ncbi:MAG: PHP domain-containing protein, partial [Vampirovibrionia bacterium]
MAVKKLYSGIDSLIDYKKAIFPDDWKYIQMLADKSGHNPEKLATVLGPDELCNRAKLFVFDDFCAGKNLENTKNGSFKINMHSHTLDSDGKMSLENFLEQVAKYSSTLKDSPYIFAITNHDIVRDSRKALDIIAQNQKDFVNTLFIPGVELSVQYINDELFYKPVSLELLNYCIDPYDEALLGHLTIFSEDNYDAANLLINQLNEKGLMVSFEDAVKWHNLIKTGTSPAFLPLLKEYFVFEANKQGISTQIVNSIISEFVKFTGNEFISRKTPSIEWILSNLTTGVIGMSHPGRVEMDYLNENVTSRKAITTILDHFKVCGGKFVEVNYQYHRAFHNFESVEFLEYVKKYCFDIDLLPAG